MSTLLADIYVLEGKYHFSASVDAFIANGSSSCQTSKTIIEISDRMILIPRHIRTSPQSSLLTYSSILQCSLLVVPAYYVTVYIRSRTL